MCCTVAIKGKVGYPTGRCTLPILTEQSNWTNKGEGTQASPSFAFTSTLFVCCKHLLNLYYPALIKKPANSFSLSVSLVATHCFRLLGLFVTLGARAPRHKRANISIFLVLPGIAFTQKLLF